MKIELTAAKFLTLPELGELAARLDALHQKTLKTIDRLDREIEAQKTRVARHWEGIRALGPADRGRVMAEQASAAVRKIREDARPELNGGSCERPAPPTRRSSRSGPTGRRRQRC